MSTDEQASTVSLDDIARSIVRRSGLRFSVAQHDDDLDAAFRLRADAVAAQGWTGQDRDGYDDRAVHVLGWSDDEPVCAGRIVFPPGPLPTEAACGLVVEPAGRVADVGRMVVAPSHQEFGHGRFVALMAGLYLEVRAQGFTAACGMMAARVRALTRFLGLRLQLLGPERPYRGELRAPVYFELERNFPTLAARWGPESRREDEDGVGAAEAERIGDGAARSDRPGLADDRVDGEPRIETT